MNPLKALRAIAHHQLGRAHGAPTGTPVAAVATPVPTVAAPGPEPLRGKELHVAFTGIVPTDPFANVRVTVSQTAHYEPGHGLTLKDREAILSRESDSLNRVFLEKAEKLRAALSDDAYVRPSARPRLPSPRNRLPKGTQ